MPDEENGRIIWLRIDFTASRTVGGVETIPFTASIHYKAPTPSDFRVGLMWYEIDVGLPQDWMKVMGRIRVAAPPLQLVDPTPLIDISHELHEEAS